MGTGYGSSSSCQVEIKEILQYLNRFGKWNLNMSLKLICSHNKTKIILEFSGRNINWKKIFIRCLIVYYTGHREFYNYPHPHDLLKFKSRNFNRLVSLLSNAFRHMLLGYVNLK